MPQSDITGKKRLLLLTGTLLVIGFLATIFASYFVSKDALKDEITLYELPLTSDNIFSEIQNDLIRPTFISSMMAHDTFLRDWVINGEKNTDEVSNYLREVKEKFNAFSSFFVSENSRNYYYAGGILKKVDKAEPRDRWYFRVREMNAPYETNIDPDLANDDALTVFINYRVLDYDGNYIGVTGVGLAMSALQQVIEDYQSRFHRRIYFVTPDGNVTLSSEGLDTPDLTGTNVLDDINLAPLFQEIRQSEEGDFEYSRKGDTFFLKTRFIPELNWYLFVETSDAEAIAALRQTLFFNLMICLLVTVITVGTLNKTFGLHQRKLEIMATTDKLTGVLNRQALDLISEQSMKNADRSGAPLSIILFDIDEFKGVNDTHGHLAGDRVIQHVAEISQQALRDSDVICRWGGDEFILLLQNCDLENACQLAKKVREALENQEVQHQDTTIPVSISMGVAQYHPGESEDELLSRVDKALYGAKKSGRNKMEAA